MSALSWWAAAPTHFWRTLTTRLMVPTAMSTPAAPRCVRRQIDAAHTDPSSADAAAPCFISTSTPALINSCSSMTPLVDNERPFARPIADAAAIAAVLEASGAEVLLLINPTRDELEKGLRTLSDIQRKPFPEVCAAIRARPTRRLGSHRWPSHYRGHFISAHRRSSRF